MIIRVFRPTIHPGKESEFESFLRDTAIPLVSQQKGVVAQHVGRPRDPSSTEFVYVTIWEDAESIRAFAGERWQEAVIAPERGAPAQRHLDRALRGYGDSLTGPFAVSPHIATNVGDDEWIDLQTWLCADERRACGAFGGTQPPRTRSADASRSRNYPAHRASARLRLGQWLSR